MAARNARLWRLVFRLRLLRTRARGWLRGETKESFMFNRRSIRIFVLAAAVGTWSMGSLGARAAEPAKGSGRGTGAGQGSGGGASGASSGAAGGSSTPKQGAAPAANNTGLGKNVGANGSNAANNGANANSANANGAKGQAGA